MRRFNYIALGIFLVLVVGLFILGPRTKQRIQSGMLGLVAPFFKTGSSMQKTFTTYRDGLKSLEQLEQERGQLSVENKELKAENQKLNELELENTRLRAALKYRERAPFKLAPARIIARDATTWWQTLKIDRGTNDGLELDRPVITESGLVGKTTSVGAGMSTVILISDENCRVAAMVEGTREQGIVKGGRTSSASMPEITLSFLSKNAALKPGQRVLSSGIGEVYPKGLLIGVVKDFKVRELDSIATLVPAVDLTTLEDVFVITK